MCHYSLSWAKDERPDRQEMRRAAQESLKALGMERHQALIVSHRDGQPHVHVIANRVDPESGQAAGLSRSKLRLSKWAEDYEREQGERVVDGRGHSGGRWRRELGGGVREIGGAVRGRPEVLEGFRAELEDRLRWERVSLGKEHSEAARGIESKAGEFYRGGMEGSEKRAREAARSDGLLLDSYRRPDEFYRLKYSMLEERLEQVREIDGELAYEKMRRAVEKASQEKARQVEWARQETARQSRERPGPERGGPERDFGPSR